MADVLRLGVQKIGHFLLHWNKLLIHC